MDHVGVARSGRQPRPVRVAGLAQYLALTIALGGLQFVWSVETGFGTLYLLSLGMRKSLVSLVWLAGPLSGLITQPLVGALSDSCTSRLGRRRPYIIGSTICVVMCLFIIGWTRELVGDRPAMVVWLAVVAFYVLDFAINCIQASLRALIVDSLPASLQDAGTAWASRMIGIGNTVGYLMGFLDLARLLPFLGSSHMQVLTSIASLVLALTVAITCYYTPETPIARLPSHLRNGSSSGLRALAAIFASIRSLPTTVRDVCRVQLFSWIGWFPFLFYGTTYVANLYVADNSGDGTGGPDLMERGTRAGSLAMFAYALSSLGFSVILPYFAYSSTAHAASRQHRASIDTQSTFGRIMQIARKVRLAASASLATIWMVSLGVFAIAMLFTFAVSTARGATWLVAVCGFCWAVTIWVPFSIIGQVISSGATSAGQPARTENRDDGYIYVEATDIAMDDLSFNTHDGQPRELFENDEAAHHYPLDSSSISAGTVLGIHNIFIVLPQFITAFVSSLIFAYFEHANRSKPEKTGGEHAHEVALVLRLGGMSSAVAVYYAWKLRRRV